jgi:hypothetical protein
MTLEEAKQLKFHQTVIGKGNIRWRVNGKVKLWKRSPEKVLVPLKFGLYKFDYIIESNLEDFHLPVAPIQGSN